MTLWQRIKSWFGFKPKQVTPARPPRTDIVISLGRSTPVRSAGESEIRDRNIAAFSTGVASVSRQPAYVAQQQVHRPSRAAVSSPVVDRSDSLLDTVTTVLAVDAVTDIISDLLKTDPQPEPARTVGWGDHEERVRSENAYNTAREQASQPAEPESSTRFDDTRSSSFDDSGSRSSSWDDSGSSNWSD